MVCFTLQVILGSFPKGGMSGALKLERIGDRFLDGIETGA